MELKLQPEVKAAVEVNGQVIINLDNSTVFGNFEDEEAYIYIKSNDPGSEFYREVKIRFLKKDAEIIQQ